MDSAVFDRSQLEEAWQPSDERARWRTMSGHQGTASGSALLEVEAGCKLPRHTDSAEEAIAVVAGEARVTVGEDSASVPSGGIALVPAGVSHFVENAADETLRFIAFYASNDVTTTYDEPVEPDGSRERESF